MDIAQLHTFVKQLTWSVMCSDKWGSGEDTSETWSRSLSPRLEFKVVKVLPCGSSSLRGLHTRPPEWI